MPWCLWHPEPENDDEYDRAGEGHHQAGNSPRLSLRKKIKTSPVTEMTVIITAEISMTRTRPGRCHGPCEDR